MNELGFVESYLTTQSFRNLPVYNYFLYHGEEWVKYPDMDNTVNNDIINAAGVNGNWIYVNPHEEVIDLKHNLNEVEYY
jgi:hypothetical protein